MKKKLISSSSLEQKLCQKLIHGILTRDTGISHPQRHHRTQQEQKTEWQKPNQTRAQSANFHAKCQSAHTKQVTLVTSSKEETSSLLEKNGSVRVYQDLEK